MGRGKKPIRQLRYLVLAAGVAVVAGCGQHAANTPPAQNLQSVQSASAPPQPYTVVAQLPAKPAVVEDHRRSLHLTYTDNHYYLADNSGDDYDCARDSHGNLYPAYYDREIGQYCPLYYDADRDRYYCAVRDNGRFYRRYWDDPHDLYYDDYDDYDDYQPPAEDRPVIYIQKNYYDEYNYGSNNRTHHGHNNDALLAAIPIVAVAFVALSHSGHHDHPVLAAHNSPPRPAAIYQAARPNSRPIAVSQRRTVVAQQNPPQQPVGQRGTTPYLNSLKHGPTPPGTRVPWHATANRGPQPGQPAQVAARRQMFAHKQPAPRVAVKPAPRQMPVAARPGGRPMQRAARPPQPQGKPRQMVKLPVGIHTHPMIPAGKPVAAHTHPMIRASHPGPRPAPRMAARPGPRPAPRMAARPQPPVKVVQHAAPRPVQMQHIQRRPHAAPPTRMAMPPRPHPAPRIASHQAVAPRPVSPPAYHRMPPAQSAPAQRPASSSVHAWIPTNHANPPANNGKHGGQKKNQQDQH